MDRIEAERELSWYFNVAMVRMSISAIDVSAVSCARPGWQYDDPNIAIAARARPVREALRRCPPKVVKVLTLAFTERAWRRELNTKKVSPHHDLLTVYGERLAPLIEHYGARGTVGESKAWAHATLRASQARFLEVVNGKE